MNFKYSHEFRDDHVYNNSEEKIEQLMKSNSEFIMRRKYLEQNKKIVDPARKVMDPSPEYLDKMKYMEDS